MSSVSLAAFPSEVGTELRLKRVDHSLSDAGRGAADRLSPRAADRAPGAPPEPTIVLLIHSSGLNAAALESFDIGLHRAAGGVSLGFSRVIPESALPAVREAYEQIRRRFGASGTITALAVEKPRGDDATREPYDARDSESLEFEEISIDPARREVWVEGSLIALTKSEFDLLYVLAQRPGVVFSRRQIVLAYKGADYPVDDRSIDVQMFNLRRKIRSAGSVLQTIRGVGYRFAGKPTA